MTLGEFKAWLDGYSASFADGAPSPDQWAEVQRRFASVTPEIISVPSAPRYPVYPAPGETWPYQPPRLGEAPSLPDWTVTCLRGSDATMVKQ